VFNVLATELLVKLVARLNMRM